MTKTPAESMVQMAKLAGDMVEAIAEQEAQVLHLVQAEMDVLGNLVLTAHKATDPKEVDAEVEASFDNMPV
jgi:hypothetical protein